MTIESLFAHYGAFAIMLGAGIEGETTVITGGVLAHQKLIPLWQATLAAIAGSFIADQLLFLLGRHYQQYTWVNNTMKCPAFSRAATILERHPATFILSFRFIIGLRTASPIAVGVSDVPAPTYIFYNGISAIIWGTLFTLIGYAFGNAVEAVFEKYRGDMLYIVTGVLAVALIVGGIVRLRNRTTRS